MIKVKDGYAKLIGTTYLGSSNHLLLSNGGAWEVHTGRNNEANKIVRTDSNGFLLTGWINTTSGDTGTNTINKIYCSNDSYIRYKTPANFFSTLTNSGDNISITVASLNRTLTVLYANIAGLLRSKGTIAPLTGRTLSLGDVYSYHLNASVSGGPTTYAAVIGFGKGTSGTVEIAGEWTSGRGVWVRALRDVTDNWYSWDKILTLATYTGITDSRYYTKTLSDDRFVNITGDTMTGELSNSNSNAYRLIRTNYGVILRNDDSSFHILLTNSGSPTGSFNSLRPFSIALSSGRVSLGNGLTVSGTISGNNTITGTLLISTIANGTSPLLVTSRTLVSNLNADLLDGFNSTDFLRLYKISNVDVSTLLDTLLYWTDTDANSGTLTNAPFILSHAILLVKNYINDTDYRRSRLAFDAYGNLKTFNDRGTAGNSGVWYTVLTNSNYSSIINNNYYTKTESDNRYLLKGSAVNSNNNASWLSFANNSGGIGGTMGSNDFWRIYGRSTAGNAGYLEIATADDGNEPIYVRLYTGVFSTLKRTLVLLDGSGNSIFPGRIKVSNPIESSLNTATFLLGNKGYALISSTASAGAYVMLHRGNSTNGYFTIGTYLDKYLLQYTKSTTVTNDSNTVDKLLILLNEGGNSSFPGTVSVSGSINSNSTNGILIPNNSSKVTKTSSNWIHGGVDSCSNSDANLRFGSWYGIGWYPTISGQTVALGMNAMWLNVRTGVLLVANEVKSIKFTGTLVGNADSATKLTSNAGNRILPVYFSDGKPVACSFLYYYTFNNNNIPYIKLFTLKITGAYINTPITFNIKGRSGREAFIAIKFSNVSTTDPTITYFKGWGGYSGYYTRLRICKTDTSTWEIWKMSLVEGYDSGYIWDMLVPGGITFTWNNTTSSTEPTYTTYTNCTIETLSANISGNSATSDKWKTARSITLGNYLSGSTTLDGSSNVTLNATVKGLTSLGNKTAISGTTIPEDGLRMYLVYNNGYPCTFGNLISVKGAGSGELLLQWQGDNNPGHIYYRSKRDITDSTWSNWVLVLDSSNYSSIISNNYWKVNLLTTTGTGDIYLEMWRGTNASWKMLNSGGNLYFQSNYTNAVGNYFNVLTLNYNSGNATIKGMIRAASAFINSGDATLKIYSGRTLDAVNDGNICLQTSIDGTDGQTHAYPTLYGSRCTISLQPRGGSVYIGSNPTGNAYKFYVNGTSLFNNTVRIQYNTPNLYIKNTVDTSYSIIRFGTNSNENASYIFQNGPSRTDDGGANTMTIRNNVGHLRLDNATSITGLLTVTSKSTHKGIKVGDNYINAIDGLLIIQNNTAIRFGDDAWDYNVWAGLKYDSSNKTIYLGLADGTIFKANSALSGGSLRFPGISNIYATTFNGTFNGNASSATKLTSSAGSAELPIYFSDGKPVACVASSIFSNLSNSGNNLSVTVAGLNRTLMVGYASNADKVDGYHANKIYNAPMFTVNNGNTSNTYILLATITIGGTSLANAEFTTLFQNRECLDKSSFILSGAIRRNSTTSVTATLSYITLHTGTPRNIYMRSNDGVTFMVYIQSVTGTWTTYYRAIPIVDSGNITYSNIGTTSPISGSVLNITATKGGNVNYANSAGSAETATTASKLGTSTVGAANVPIYLNAGTPTVVDLNSTANNLINSLSIGTATPLDNDYYVCLYAGGGTTTTTYHRRPVSSLYNYIKNKAEGTWKINVTGNAATATKLQTARTLWGLTFDGTANVSGNMSGVGLITFSDLTGTNGRSLLYLKMADNDYFRIYVGGTASNSGYAEIATADDGNEPIYVRQYTGVFSTIKRTLTLLDGSGNTSFPGNITTTGLIYASHFYENSDVRLKHNIELIHDSNNIPEIKLFDWKESGKHSYGLIALELEENGYSELVETKEDGYKSVNYSAALSLIIGKLQVKIRELEKEIENLKIKS